ncbi:polyamine-modulated factor 1-binding protein 1-like [Hydractinia symbiolongicarpus]|uniref:polyamine-modulated factor 1-binding protein 1-like n=1 Tax=Hydractinia symbiolongicarpus TaxID=13093 RepID=UPI00254FBB90|nr:polyamine-modulated factor 1-binding protein 1-like [Hydractinia symbiolongicarpus]
MLKNKTAPVNIYWENAPLEDEQIKDVLRPGVYNEPGKIINASSVKAVAKPWLQNKKTTDRHKFRKNEQEKKIVSKQQTGQICSATLRDLRKEDKQKVANLIKELARYGEEKENAIKQLNFLSSDFEAKLSHLEEEKQCIIREKDMLKEKLLKTEIEFQERKKQSEIASPDSKHLKNSPGNIRTLHLQHTVQKLNSQGNTDKFPDVFYEQQLKFEQQQEILQQQIEQLQKLQESLMLQQAKKPIKKPSSSQESFLEESSIHVSNEQRGENSLRLEKYILQDKSQDCLLSLKKEKSNILSQDALIQNTTLTELPISASEPKKVDMCMQTESSPRKSPDNRLEQCEKSISLIEQSLQFFTSKDSSRRDTAPIKYLSSPYSNAKSLQKTHKARHSPKNQDKRKAQYCKQSNSKDLLTSLIHLSSESDESDAEECSTLLTEPKYDNLDSAVKRKHFKPSSMVQLAEGLQPRSTSTSIDQHSLQNSKNVNVSKTEIDFKRIENKKFANTYAKQTFKGSESHIDDNFEEQTILDDIFFNN